MTTSWLRRWIRPFTAAAIPVLAASIFAVASRAEVIGPYDIVDTPASAVLVSGGGASFNWLNVVNTPVSIQEAFTGFSVIDDGFGNAQSGTIFRLTYAAGVLRNLPGPDLVLLDAGNDGNQYRVRTSFNNYSTEILVNASGDTGVDRSYFFGGTGPTTFDIDAATIDLSSLGVPDGATVDTVQLFTEGGSNDLLGLGVLRPGVPVPAASGWVLLTTMALLLAGGAWFVLGRHSRSIISG